MTKTYDDPERYNGWTNRETWAVALHINNDQGWQESVHEALREQWLAGYISMDQPARAGEIVRENVESELDYTEAIDNLHNDPEGLAETFAAQCRIRDDIGSLWRVDWTELGAAFLSDLEDDA